MLLVLYALQRNTSQETSQDLSNLLKNRNSALIHQSLMKTLQDRNARRRSLITFVRSVSYSKNYSSYIAMPNLI
jgi:hypothetical protein